MLTAHYLHRLPADYDLNTIRARARSRGPVWDHAADLYFKGFLVREAGKHGAIENSYSSLYLWRSSEAFANFLLTDRYRTVTNSFGRADIHTRVVLDACRGHARNTQYVFEENSSIPRDADLAQALSREVEANRALAAQAHVVVAVTAIDTVNWQFTRYLLAESEGSAPSPGAVIYEAAHLSQPLLNTLPDARR